MIIDAGTLPNGLQISIPGEIGVVNPAYPVGDIRRYGARCDGVTDDGQAIDNAIASARTITGPFGLTSFTSRTHTLSAGKVFNAWGFTLLSSVAGNALVLSDFAYVGGITQARSGSPGASVALAIGTASTTGHHARAEYCAISGFDQGVVLQLSFYVVCTAVDSHDNITRNWRLTNTAISNDLVGCMGRGGAAATLYGLVIDDATANSSNNRVIGGTYEGNAIQQIAIFGGDKTTVVGTHCECHAPDALTGTCTFTNGSAAVSGAGTLFLAEVLPGQYVKLQADNGRFWRRVQSVTNNTNIVLEELYDGATASNTGSVNAGNVLVMGSGGAANGNQLLNLELGVASDSAPGIYVGAGSSKTQIVAGSVELPVIVSRTADLAEIVAPVLDGNLNDQGTNSQIWANPQSGQYYSKIGTNIAWGITTGGVVTTIASNTVLAFPTTIRGQFQIAGAATSVNVPIANIDTNYFVMTSGGRTASSGTPAAGSNRILSIVKAAAQFTVTVEAAPGVGNTVTFDYWMVR